MSFTPATGSNSDVANSYLDVAYADAYFADRGVTAWTGIDSVKQAALIRATDFIEQAYGQSWVGRAVGEGLSWPRYFVAYNDDVIPNDLRKATCELALEALAGALNPVSGGSQNVIRKKVDVIEVEYDKAVTARRRPAVDGYLRSLLSSSVYNRPVVRV